MVNHIKIKNICCIGAGYVGGPTMAVIADHCPHINIVVIDHNKKRINAWNDENLDKLPIFEPGLKEIISRVRNRNLFFTSNTGDHIKNSDMIFISVNTPIKTKGLGAGQASNLYWVESCAREIALKGKGFTIVVEKSTLPVRTAETIKHILDNSTNSNINQVEKSFSVLSNPEFLSEGNAINDLENPDRILIGGEDNSSIKALEEIYLNWVPKSKIIHTNLWSSELSKLTANAFLAQRISSINSISALCETTGANVMEVSHAVGLDKRIGSEFLNPGPGFGGSCFKKDILNLVYICRFLGLDEVADYWESVVLINSWQQKRIYSKIVSKLYGNILNKQLTILGFTFKSNTNDTRESPAIQISYDLISEGAQLVITDPKVNPQQVRFELNRINNMQENPIEEIDKKWKFERDTYKSVKDSDAIIFLTDWEEYRHLNWEEISTLMRLPSWVFDTRNVTNKNKLAQLNLNYWKLGDC